MKYKDVKGITTYGEAKLGHSRAVPPGEYEVFRRSTTNVYRGGASGIKPRLIAIGLHYEGPAVGRVSHYVSLEGIR